MALPADPRLRLGMGLVLILAVSQLGSLPVALGAVALALGLAVLAGGIAALWHRLLHVEAFMALLFLSLPFTVPGVPLFDVGPLTASHEGAMLAALIAAKVTAAVVLAFAFLGSLDPAQLGPALRALHLPEPLVRLFLMMLRYLSVIRLESTRLQEAMRARSFRPRSNRHTWRSYGNLAGMLLLRGLNRARRVEEAMLCRGDAGLFPQAALPPLGLRGWLPLAGALGLALALTLADRL